jgi:alkaline phosphatase D
VFRSVPVGRLADVLVVDTRSRRDEPVPAPAMHAPDRSALGPEQRDWLFGELESSTAAWRLLANPSVMAKTWSADLPDAVKPALTKVKLLESDGDGPDWDQWDGYPAERTAVLELLSRVPDTVVLSGDVHVSLAVEMDLDGDDGTPDAVEFVTPSLTSQNLDDKMGWARHTDSVAIEQAIVAALPHWRWCDLDSHGYVIVDVDTSRIRAEWWHLDTVLERSDGEELGAAFVVERGVAGLLPG